MAKPETADDMSKSRRGDETRHLPIESAATIGSEQGFAGASARASVLARFLTACAGPMTAASDARVTT